MGSSISDSKSQAISFSRAVISDPRHPALVYAKALVAICAAITVLLEIGSSHLLRKDSVTYERVSSQYAQALRARPGGPGEPTSVVLVGNSLLLYGVDMGRLEALTSGRMQVYPIFLEATGYYDWLFALRRLFRNGARPQVVVVGLAVNEFMSNSVRPNYGPVMFFNTPDAFRAASELKMNPTQTTGFLLEHFSSFWNMRSVIRMQVLRHILPHCQDLFSMLSARPPIPPAREFSADASARLKRLRDLCEAHGAKLVILVPPTPASEDAVHQLTIASQRAGVQTLVPIDPATLPNSYYLADEVHLNPNGAVLFTSALAADLSKTLGAVTNRPS